MREVARQARSRGLRVGLVPTMGSLHRGHLSLIEGVNKLTDIVVTSIFVNPTQFGPEEDFDRYPRELTKDADQCVAQGVDYLFAPETNEIYPPGPRTYVEVTELSDRLEGASRPGHFRGVTTVVMKLLQIVQPSVAVFGRKDAQQALIVQRMVRDLMLDVEILTLPTVRDDDGLALSSRNAQLSPAQRKAAAAIPRSLKAAQHVVAEGQTRPEEVIRAAQEVLESEPLLRVDYVEIVDGETLAPLSLIEGQALILVAVHCGETRLIDNEVLL
jgi:pantoate--beta-alanine ligase